MRMCKVESSGSGYGSMKGPCEQGKNKIRVICLEHLLTADALTLYTVADDAIVKKVEMNICLFECDVVYFDRWELLFHMK